MTDIKKTTKDKGPAKVKKLQLHKEALRDLTPRRAEGVRGGQNKGQTTYCEGTTDGQAQI